MLVANPVFTELPLFNDPRRERLPFFVDSEIKLNIWGIIKDSVGKDLSKFAVPVYLNEPLSMLQRLAEEVQYPELL